MNEQGITGDDPSVAARWRPSRLAAVHATHLLDTGPEEAFDRLARLAGAVLGVPYAFVTIVDGSRSFWKSCIGVDATVMSDRQNAVEESFCQYVIDGDDSLIVSDARLDELTRANPSIATMGVVAWAGYPLRSIDGHVLGTFCVVDTAVHDWTTQELEILAALAGAVEGEIQLRTLLEQRSQLADRTRLEMSVRENLATFAELLSGADTTDAVSAVVTGLGAEVLGASLATLDRSGRYLVVSGGVTDDARLSPKYRTIALTEELPIVDAVHSRTDVLLSDRAEIARRYPHVVSDVDILGLLATASVPLLHSNGEVVGALTIGWPAPLAFDSSDRALLKTVTLMCAQSIQRAQLGDLRRELVESLQQELLPAVPVIPGLRSAVRYLPANVGIGIGGDWFDIIDLGDGRAVVVVGDIAGHGIEAAARMAQVRGAINALIRMHADDLARVVPQAEAMLQHLNDGYLATIVVLVIDVAAGTVRYVSAGHPPAIIVAADGSATLLQDGRFPVLGSGATPRDVGSALFPDGAVLVAYSDGLIERRGETIDSGIDRVVAVATARAVEGELDLDVESLAERLVDELVGEGHLADDVALVVIQRCAPDVSAAADAPSVSSV